MSSTRSMLSPSERGSEVQHAGRRRNKKHRLLLLALFGAGVTVLGFIILIIMLPFFALAAVGGANAEQLHHAGTKILWCLVAFAVMGFLPLIVTLITDRKGRDG